MRWSDIPFTPTDRTLRQFAGIWIVFFTGFACWQGFVRENTTLAAITGVLAATVGPVGLVWPRLIRPIYVGWMVLAFPIGWVVSRLLLGIVFYGVFTPVGLLFRLCGRDVLRLRPQPVAADTYWTAKETATDPKRYFRQF